MTATDPSREHEASNHRDAQFTGPNIFLSTRPRRRRPRRHRPDGAHAPSPTCGTSEAQFDKIVVLRGFSQLIAPRATFPTFHLDTPNDRSACANGGVDVQELPVRTSAPAALRVPATRDSWAP